MQADGEWWWCHILLLGGVGILVFFMILSTGNYISKRKTFSVNTFLGGGGQRNIIWYL
jgi:hypothetical protein